MNSRILKLFFDYHFLREIFKRFIISRLKLIRYDRRVQIGAVKRPAYGYCVYHGMAMAKKLGYDRVSILEFGVSKGDGLLNLECHARQASKLLSIEADVYGFDMGDGLPPPKDYRDLPYHWKEGFFKMDVPALRDRLSKAKLILGDITSTLSSFVEQYNPAPIAAIMFDFDYYSSTIASLKVFDFHQKYYLPRVYCYFDDIIGTELELFNDYTGERLAIREFNESHKSKKLSPACHLLAKQIVEPWYHQIFVHHDFEHAKYNDFVGITS